VFEDLVRGFPSVPEYREQLAATRHNLGEHEHKQENYPEAVQAFQQSEALSESLMREHPLMPTYRADMANSLRELGITLEALGQAPEAAKKFSRSLELCNDLIRSAPDDASHLARLALAHLAMKNHAAATVTAEKLLRLSRAPATNTYDAACLYSRSIRIAAHDASLPELDRQELASRYSDRAIELLRNAVQEGFENYGRLATDSDLDPLRSRPEFIRFTAELVNP
jgi:tetratricopeptide (TPR) repeat protein